MERITGKISQIIGPVVDVHFDLAGEEAAESSLPRIHDALQVTRPDGRSVMLEVQQHFQRPFLRGKGGRRLRERQRHQVAFRQRLPHVSALSVEI